MNGTTRRVVGTMRADELRQLLQRCHWIAARRGAGPPTTIFGFGVRAFLENLRAAGALWRDSHFSGYAVRDHVVSIIVHDDGSFVVVR